MPKDQTRGLEFSLQSRNLLDTPSAIKKEKSKEKRKKEKKKGRKERKKKREGRNDGRKERQKEGRKEGKKRKKERKEKRKKKEIEIRDRAVLWQPWSYGGQGKISRSYLHVPGWGLLCTGGHPTGSRISIHVQAEAG